MAAGSVMSLRQRCAYAARRVGLAWAYRLHPLLGGLALLATMVAVVVSAVAVYHGAHGFLTPVLQTWSPQAQGWFKALMWFSGITAGGRALWKFSLWAGDATGPMTPEQTAQFYRLLREHGYRAAEPRTKAVWVKNNVQRAERGRPMAWEWWLVSSTLAPERLAAVRSDQLHRSLPAAAPSTPSKERF